jgi:uncharacterized membrane protein
MNYKHVFNINTEWNYKTLGLLTFLILIPNFLGMINVVIYPGFKVHFFQIAIFLAAAIYGPSGGALSGFIGSFYAAIAMSNPYIVFGNALLGFFVGYLIRENIHLISAVLAAFCIQLPWLIVSDYFLTGMPLNAIGNIVITLAVSNIIWAVIISRIIKPIRGTIK